MSEYSNPRPNAGTPYSDPCAVKDMAVTFGKVVEGGVNVTTYNGVVIKSLQQTLDGLGVIYSDPIKDWSASLLVSQVEAHRYPAVTGDIYVPIAPLPFVTGATFDPTKWAIIQGTGDLDGITVKPVWETPIIANGTQTRFSVPGTVLYSPTRYQIYLDGMIQTQVDSASNNRWVVEQKVGFPNEFEVVFSVAPLAGVEVGRGLWQPIDNGDNNSSADSVFFKQAGVGAVTVTVEDKLSESASLRDYGATGIEGNDATQAFINACNEHSVVYVNDGYYSLTADSIPDTAKVRKIVVQNAILWLEDGQFDFSVAGHHLDLDLTAGGDIQLGLRHTTSSADVAVGSTVIPCYETAKIVVGQTIATSFQAVGATGGSKWTNSIRVAGDEFNTVIAKTADSITVQYPVGAAGTNTTNSLWKNMVLGNANFNRAGLRFNGYGKVTIRGGKIRESLAGYYVSTEGVDTDGGLIVECHDVDFSGQFLDGFRIAGYSSFLAYGGSMIGSYDYSKQLFVTRHFAGHKVRLESVRIHRGNNDLDFYSFDDAGGKIGLVELVNCDLNGTWTLPIAKDQLNTITGQTLNSVYAAQDSLHVWTCELLKPTAPETVSLIEGFIATDCTFTKYRRAVAGTTFINYARNFLVDNLILRNCIFNETAPFYISVNNLNSFNITNKELSNAIIKRNSEGGSSYPLGYYNGNNATSFLDHTGSTVYDNNGGTIANVFIPQNMNFESLTIKGSGTALMTGGGAVVKRLILDGGTLQMSGNFDPKVPTEVTKKNGGSFNGFIPYEVDIGSYTHKRVTFPETALSSQVLRSGVDLTKTSHYLTITVSGFRIAGGTYGVSGVILANIKTDGTVTSVNMPAAFGYANNLAVDGVAKWAGNAMSHGFSISDGFFTLSISGGNLIMSNTSTLPEDLGLSVTIIGG